MANATKFDDMELEVPTFGLEGVETNNKEVGKSTVSCEIDMGGRKLTEGEIALAKELFKDAIDYDKVRIHKHEYKGSIFTQLFQTTDAAVTPNGEMYFLVDKQGKEGYMEDFSKPRDPNNKRSMREKQWFMHEMVHVWQYQLGYDLQTPENKINAVKPGGRDYTLEPKNRLKDYNMEQQGNILCDYWLTKDHNRQDYLWEKKYRRPKDTIINSGFLALVELVLSDFFKNRKDAANLPPGKRRS
jgi:hypothetical protein